jgi:hypothetical protein
MIKKTTIGIKQSGAVDIAVNSIKDFRGNGNIVKLYAISARGRAN